MDGPAPGAPSSLVDALFARDDLRPYAVADGAARRGLRSAIGEAERACLFLGELEPEVAAAAPWLVALGRGSRALEALLAGWGRAQAIYLASPASLIELRTRLRTMTMVETPDRRRLWFRFYDPRVLRGVAPILDETQRARFRRAAPLWLCEAEKGELFRFEP